MKELEKEIAWLGWVACWNFQVAKVDIYEDVETEEYKKCREAFDWYWQGEYEQQEATDETEGD